jgi:hypothetical protein
MKLQELEEHVYEDHGARILCNSCYLSFATATKLAEHIGKSAKCRG